MKPNTLQCCQLRMLFSGGVMLNAGGEVGFECAFVRWYTPVRSHPRCDFLGQRFEWEAAEGNSKGYGVVALRRILGPAYMQADPRTEGACYYNAFAIENQAFHMDKRFASGDKY